jgi:membrane protease YdiL (CAAX protease family)
MELKMEAILLPTKRKFSWKVFLIVLALVLVAGLLKTPMIIANGYAGRPELWKSIILQVTLKNFVLFGLPGALGLLLANRVGLGLPFIEGWGDKRPLKGKIGKMALIALVAAVGLTAIGIGVRYLTLPMILTEFEAQNIPLSALGESTQAPWWAMLPAALSAGITEEVGFRLGLLTLLIWVFGWFWHAEAGRTKPIGFWLANVLVAVLFGAFHLLNISALGLPLMSGLIIRAILGNGLLALAFGWLYWTYGLESAMLTHFIIDALLYVVLPLVI